jgi:hypothetical protein
VKLVEELLGTLRVPIASGLEGKQAFRPSLKAVMAGHTGLWAAMGWRASQDLGHKRAWSQRGRVMQNGVLFWGIRGPGL